MQSDRYLQAGVTLIVGLFVFILYIWQKRDSKKNAAKIIEVEISGAEDKLKELKVKFAESSGNEIVNSLILSSNSWTKYKHLFINNFTAKQWRKISEFYDNCELLNEAVREKDSFFGQNSQAIRTARYNAAASFVTKAINDVAEGKLNITHPDGTSTLSSNAEVEVKSEVENKMRAFNQILEESLNATNAHYNPMKPINDTDRVLKYMNTEILDGDIGIRLRQISTRRF